MSFFSMPVIIRFRGGTYFNYEKSKEMNNRIIHPVAKSYGWLPYLSTLIVASIGTVDG